MLTLLQLNILVLYVVDTDVKVSYWLNPLNSSLYFSLFFVVLQEFFCLALFIQPASVLDTFSLFLATNGEMSGLAI